MPICKSESLQKAGKIERILVLPYCVLIFSDTIEAYACGVEKANITKFLSFFGIKYILDRSLEYHSCTEKERTID